MEMTRKALKALLLVGLVALLALTAGGVMASSKTKGELPEYLGSDACLGCHADKFVDWEMTGHAHMLVEISKPSDFPGDIASISEELKAELMKADFLLAGQRFLARDPATGDYKYLSVQWNGTQYVAYNGGSNWNDNCAGCHSTGYDKATRTFSDHYIGCEACHGPGKEHLLGRRDVSKITASTDSQVCGQCHTGGTMADGSRWAVGYRPGMKLDEFLNLPVVDPHATPPSSTLHWRQYPLWAASAHATAVTSLESSGHANASCYKCHAAEAFSGSLAGKTFDPKTHAPYNAVTCVACHDPHNSTEPGQLRMEPEALCVACHNGSIPEGGTLTAGATPHHPMKEMLAGYGAIGIAQTKGAHSELTCVECHMTEGNHLMAVIKPEDVAGTTRKDSCTACHKHSDSSSESRGVYLELWQESVTLRLEACKAAANAIDARIKTNPNALSQEWKDKVAAAKTNYLFVEADASKGAHNFEYAIKILTAAQKDLETARGILK